MNKPRDEHVKKVPLKNLNIAFYKTLRDELTLIKSKGTEGQVKKALNALRNYLDGVGFKMPMPKYKFDIKDITTHRYLDSKVVTLDKEPHAIEVLNPEFKYGHLV